MNLQNDREYLAELAGYEDSDILHDYLVMREDFGADDRDVRLYLTELKRRHVDPRKYQIKRNQITGITRAVRV